MNWKDLLVREFAGRPSRVAVNLCVLAAVSMALGYWGLGMPVGDRLVMGAMAPGLVGILSGALIKEQDPRRPLDS